MKSTLRQRLLDLLRTDSPLTTGEVAAALWPTWLTPRGTIPLEAWVRANRALEQLAAEHIIERDGVSKKWWPILQEAPC